MNSNLKQSCTMAYSTGLLIFLSLNTLAQDAVGIRFTPVLVSSPRLTNSLPANISSLPAVSFNAGIHYSHMFKSPWGLRSSLEFGLMPARVTFKAPRNAFGTKQGSGDIDELLTLDPYFYSAASAQILRRFNAGNFHFYSYAGPALRYYYGANVGNTLRQGYNRIPRYDPDDPNAGQPDILIDIPPMKNRLSLNISTGIGLERQLSVNSSFGFGIQKNWSLSPIGDGTLQVQMNNQLYNGRISPRGNYLGIDMMFNYQLTGKKVSEYSRVAPTQYFNNYRKSYFIEYIGNGISVSGNFDMRLQKNRNDGIGFRAGVGLGTYYATENGGGQYLTVPLGINYIVGKRKSGFESGIGITPQIAPETTILGDPQFMLDTYLNLGYRFQPTTNGLLFRATWTPYLFKGNIYQQVGLSAGYSFYTLHRDLEKRRKNAAKSINIDGQYRKAIFLEAGGNGILSANFDIRLKPNQNNGLGIRGGIGIIASGVLFPIGVNYVVGKRRNGFESGIGITPFYNLDNYGDDRKFEVWRFFNLGYRLQSLNNGFLLRVIYSPYWDKELVPWFGGLSLGYSFK